MAIGAGPGRYQVRIRQREARCRVIKFAIGPLHGVVTGLARSREPGGRVGDRRGGVVVIGLMAGDASRARQVVIVVDVAIGALAWRNRVIPREREPGAGMVECRIHPVRGVMAAIASLGEIRTDVVGARRSLVVLQVAAHARRRIQAVIIVDVAIGAGPRRNCMQTREREPSAGMVERGIHPVRGVMAGIASLREVCRDVIRVCGPLEVFQVAAHAGCTVQAVVIVDVAVSAGPRWHRVHPSERETGAGMVERRVHPVGRVVALLASLREIRGNVIRVCRSLEVFQVAAHAGCAVQVVIIVDVAISAGAWRHRVQPCERESSAAVIKRCV